MRIAQVALMLLILTTIIGGGHVAVFYAIKSVISLTAKQITILAWTLAALSISFVLMSIIINSFYSWVGSWLYTTSAVWLGTAYRLLMASILTLLIIGVAKLTGLTGPRSVRVGRGLMLIAVGLSIYGLRNGNNTQITSYTVPVSDLPAQWEGKKIAMIADTHVGTIRNTGLIKRIKSIIESQGVEMLLVAGDYYDGPKANDETLAQALGTITTPHGTFLAPGNHEEYGGVDNYLAKMRAAGVQVLTNEVISISGLQIVGVNYHSTTSSSGFAHILSELNINPDQPSILIKHVPNNVEIVDQFGVDIQVAGHVHQGQVWPGPWITRKVFGMFAYGMNQIGESIIITTSGVGTRGPPQRVGTKSEIVVMTLTKKE